jgi:hypothetical protein
MFKLEITLIPKNQTVVDDIAWAVNYIFGFYTEEQKAQFGVEMADAASKGVIISHDDSNTYMNAGVAPMTIDTATNSIVIRYLLNSPGDFCALFVNDWDPEVANNLEPIQSYFDQNPTAGNYSFRIYDVNGGDVTHAYYDIHHQ